MFIKDFFTWLVGLTKPKVTIEAAGTPDEPVETTTVQGGVATLVQTTATTTTTTPAEIADTDLTNAITLVNNVKAALASPVAVLISDLIPVAIVGTIREDLVNDLPLIAAGLANIKIAVDTADKSGQMADVLSQIKASGNIDIDSFLHGLGARILTKITSGGVSWSLAVMSIEYFFKNVFKSSPAATAVATTAVAAAASVEQVASAVAEQAGAPAAVQNDIGPAGSDINDLQNFIQK